ncbi:hypothetical protein [Virgisporangium aurantiacum]|uniref:Uncharacterized protein n=1 Tax=Virgisporangium aurantiacum TaxID=175570 RepID=A0A8J4E0B7_9ACTN|nr:hypothetical protein [Virgisporangium aurantiacum]GIJ56636.1 hypothetical protein Vau01_041520 [Virgisporangium aurantiacum]
MLEATKAGVFSRSYDIAVDGRRVASWSGRFWRNGGDITLGGQAYRVEATTFTNRFTMTDAAGRTVATAEKAGRKHWTVVADGRPHRFRRTSIWGNRQDLLVGDQAVGSIRRTSMWSGRVEAELPTLSLPAQIFVVGVMITTWDNQAAAASG